MAAPRLQVELSMKRSELAQLRSIARSRTEPAGRVERARILLAYRKDPSFYAVGQALGLHAQTVQRCIERAKAEGALAALDERPRRHAAVARQRHRDIPAQTAQRRRQRAEDIRQPARLCERHGFRTDHQDGWAHHSIVVVTT